jgi:hypothetical protein
MNDFDWRKRSGWHDSPSAGIYNIKRKHNKDFTFYYNPEDTVYNWSRWNYDSHTRKKSLSFTFHENDYCILNYDNIKIEDLDFYINCRQDREYYLEMIPLLKQLKKDKLQELEEEEAFKDLVCKQLKLNKDDRTIKLIGGTIDWWKFKVKEKRPLVREDAKALRMIKSRVKKILYT